MGFSELIVILLIAFVVVGPEDLPKVAVWLARLFRRLRSIIREVREQTGLNDLQSEINTTKREIEHDINSLKSDVSISRELDDMSQDLRGTLSQTDNAIKKEE